MEIVMCRKRLNKLLKQYYQIKKNYDKAVKEYNCWKADVRYWFGFDNQTKNGKALHLYSHFKREDSFTWLETRECAKEYNHSLYSDYPKEEINKHRRISTEKCAECKKKVKDLNNQLQIIHDMFFNHIISNTLLERYNELEERFEKDKKKNVDLSEKTNVEGGTECKYEPLEIPYEPLEIPTKTILEMVKNGTWEGSLEQEEIEYNVEHKLYAVKQLKQYSDMLAKIKENKYGND